MPSLLCTNSRRLGLSWAGWEHLACETEPTLQQEISSQQLQRGTKPIKIFAVIITVREGGECSLFASYVIRESNHTTTGCWISYSIGVDLSCFSNWILHIPICVPSLATWLVDRDRSGYGWGLRMWAEPQPTHCIPPPLPAFQTTRFLSRLFRTIFTAMLIMRHTR